MQSYMSTTHSTNELDIEINNKKNEIQRLREEIKELELERSKQDIDFIGRIFEMKGMEYIYVLGRTSDGELYGMSFEDFEYNVDIYYCNIFKPNDIEKEISISEFRSKLKDKLRFEKLKEIFE